MYITHDQADVPILAEHLVVMNEGRIAQVGTPYELYQRPASLFVAGFVNPDPLVPALDTVPGWRVSSEFGGRVLGLRSEDVALHAVRSGAAADRAADTAATAAGLDAIVVDAMPLPSRRANLLSLDSVGDGAPVRIHAVRSVDDRDLPLGTHVHAEFLRFHVFDEASGRRVASLP